MSQFFELHYHLPEDPARLFDVAQGLAGRRSVLKRGGTVKVKPFTETCRRLLFQCIAFAVLTALAAVLVWAFHAKLKVLFFLCLVMSLVTFWTYQAGRMGYRKSWTQFRKDNRPDGTVTFTASGIREWNASDHTERALCYHIHKRTFTGDQIVQLPNIYCFTHTFYLFVFLIYTFFDFLCRKISHTLVLYIPNRVKNG